MKVIAIGGLPASGKSTLIKNLRKKLDKPKLFKYGLLKGENYDDLYILGTYNKKFGGTDTLSYAVQPHAQKFLKLMQNQNCTVLYEGDRLFNMSFIKHIKKMKYKHKLYMLKAKQNTLEIRHKERNDTQSSVWLQGRETKLNRIFAAYEENIVLLDNENKQNMKQNVHKIWQDLKNIT